MTCNFPKVDNVPFIFQNVSASDYLSIDDGYPTTEAQTDDDIVSRVTGCDDNDGDDDDDDGCDGDVVVDNTEIPTTSKVLDYLRSLELYVGDKADASAAISTTRDFAYQKALQPQKQSTITSYFK